MLPQAVAESLSRDEVLVKPFVEALGENFHKFTEEEIFTIPLADIDSLNDARPEPERKSMGRGAPMKQAKVGLPCTTDAAAIAPLGSRWLIRTVFIPWMKV